MCMCLYRQQASHMSVASSMYPTGHVSPTDDYKSLFSSDPPFPGIQQRASILRESRELQNRGIVSIHPGKSIVKQSHQRCYRHLTAVFPGSAGFTFLQLPFSSWQGLEHPIRLKCAHTVCPGVLDLPVAAVPVISKFAQPFIQSRIWC